MKGAFGCMTCEDSTILVLALLEILLVCVSENLSSSETFSVFYAFV
jgi:hypothetical protein